MPSAAKNLVIHIEQSALGVVIFGNLFQFLVLLRDGNNNHYKDKGGQNFQQRKTALASSKPTPWVPD